MPRLATAAVVSGAVLLGWALGGVASVGERLTASAPQTRFVTDRHHDVCHRHFDRREL